MNIKIEIDGEKYEIEVTEHGEIVRDEYGWPLDETYYSYELWHTPADKSAEMIGDETDYESFEEAAGMGLQHLVGILTNEDHNEE